MTGPSANSLMAGMGGKLPLGGIKAWKDSEVPRPLDAKAIRTVDIELLRQLSVAFGHLGMCGRDARVYGTVAHRFLSDRA